MRVGISGENTLRPLDEFSVTQKTTFTCSGPWIKPTEPKGTWVAMISSGGASGGCPGGYDIGVMR